MSKTEEFDIFKFAKGENHKRHIITVINNIYKGDVVASYDKNDNLLLKSQDTHIILKISFAKKYILITNTINKIQIVYGSKNNKEKNVTKRIKTFIDSIINGEIDYKEALEIKDKIDLSNKISNKLDGIEVVKTKHRNGKDGYYYKVLTRENDERESLHVSENGTDIANINFGMALDILKNVTLENLQQQKSLALSLMVKRFNDIEEILIKLSDEA